MASLINFVNRAENWGANIASEFRLVESRLLLGDKIRQAYASATSIQTPLAGEQQVALLAVRLTSILNKKVQLLQVCYKKLLIIHD